MLNLNDDNEFLDFLEQINQSDMCFKIKKNEVLLCSAQNEYEKEVPMYELAVLAEQFLIEKLDIWINSNVSYYDFKKGNKLVLTVGSNKKIKSDSFSIVVAFDETKNIVDIKNKAIVEYAFQIYKKRK